MCKIKILVFLVKIGSVPLGMSLFHTGVTGASVLFQRTTYEYTHVYLEGYTKNAVVITGWWIVWDFCSVFSLFA